MTYIVYPYLYMMMVWRVDLALFIWDSQWENTMSIRWIVEIGLLELKTDILANIYLFNVNNRNTRKRREIWTKLTIKHQKDVTDVVLVFGVFIVKFEHISTPFSKVSIVDYKKLLSGMYLGPSHASTSRKVFW